MTVSLILTTFNEAGSVDELMRSVLAQTRRPDEVVVVDGGSRDETVRRLSAYAGDLPLRVLVRSGLNISAGRNAAIAAATGEIIAVTDAGVRLAPEWLAALVRPIETGAANATAGFFRADPRSPFEAALGATVLPLVDEIDPGRFLPSSRSVAFRREAWAEAGGYPEWLDYCEDLIFDLALRRVAGPFAWAPEAVAHFRPRPSLGAFFLQYYRYARGDGKADLYRRRHAIRYGSYLAGLGLLAMAAGSFRWLLACRDRRSRARAAVRATLALGLLLAGAAAYLRRPYRRLGHFTTGRSPAERAYMLALVPMIRVTGDVAKMAGFPVGVWWRLRHAGKVSRSGNTTA